jgi:hypothetical protein
VLYFKDKGFTKVFIGIGVSFRCVHERSLSEQIDMITIIGLLDDRAIGLATSLPYLTKNRAPLVVCDPAASCVIGLKGLLKLAVSEILTIVLIVIGFSHILFSCLETNGCLLIDLALDSLGLLLFECGQCYHLGLRLQSLDEYGLEKVGQSLIV